MTRQLEILSCIVEMMQARGDIAHSSIETACIVTAVKLCINTTLSDHLAVGFRGIRVIKKIVRLHVSKGK